MIIAIFITLLYLLCYITDVLRNDKSLYNLSLKLFLSCSYFRLSFNNKCCYRIDLIKEGVPSEVSEHLHVVNCFATVFSVLHAQIQRYIVEVGDSVGNARNNHRRCSIKKLFWTISQYSQENTCVGTLQGFKNLRSSHQWCSMKSCS